MEAKKNIVKCAQVKSVEARLIETMMQLTVVDYTVRSSCTATMLPATSVGLLLHHGGRYRGWRACNSHTSTWVDNRNGISSAQS